MKIAVGSDHGGYALYRLIIDEVAHAGHQAIGVNPAGMAQPDPNDDYPDIARFVAARIVNQECERGILVCGSGVGAAVAANKINGIRAGLCHDTYSAHQGVEHDNINVLCLGARVVGSELALELVRAFLGAKFTGEERHLRRLKKVLAIESAEKRN